MEVLSFDVTSEYALNIYDLVYGDYWRVEVFMVLQDSLS